MALKRQHKGILCIILSAFCFALMNMCVRLAGDDIPSFQKSFFRNLVAAIFACGIMMKNHIPFCWQKSNLRDLLLRSIFGTMGILCNFYAVDNLVLADASMLNKMSPFFAVLFSFLILKEKIKPTQILIVVGAFIGSLFVIKPTFANMDLFPSIIGFLGGLAAGVAYTMVRKLGEAGEKGPLIVFFFSTFSTIVTFPLLVADYHPMSIVQIGILLLAGLAAAGGQFGITAAYCYAPAREISVYDYSQIIFSALIGFFMFGQMPDAYSWLGYIIICTMAIGMFLYNKNHTQVS